MFSTRQIDKPLVNRAQGTRIASEELKCRVFEVSLADPKNHNNTDRSFRKFRQIAEGVKGRNVLTYVHGTGQATDKLRSMVKNGRH
jgi:small subunit ribosomal protein S3Ae